MSVDVYKPRETKRDKFVALAEKRVVRAVKAIRVVGNLSNKTNYDYTDEDVTKILDTLEAEVDSIRGRFSRMETESGIVFKL
jgi:hypothetical protein